MDHGPEMNEKINKIKDAEESGAINDIIQYQVRRARTNEEKNQILMMLLLQLTVFHLTYY